MRAAGAAWAATMLLALIVGCSAGIVAAMRQNRMTDHLVMGLAMTGMSVPVFVVAPLLILLFVALPASAQVYRWVDEKGTVHYSNAEPPPGVRASQRVMSLRRPSRDWSR